MQQTPSPEKFSFLNKIVRNMAELTPMSGIHF